MHVDRLTVIDGCRFCPMCRDTCASAIATRLESRTPRGYALIIDQSLKRGNPLPEGASEVLYDCTQCGLCRETCASSYDLPDAILEARRRLVQKGDVHQAVRDAKSRYLDVFGGTGMDATAQAPSSDPFTLDHGGLESPQAQPIVNALRQLAPIAEREGANINVDALAQAPTCEHVLEDLGYLDEAIEQAQRHVKAIEDSGAKVMVTTCSECYDMFVRRYPKWGVELPHGVRVQFITQWLADAFGDALDLGRQENKQSAVPLDKTLLYHDADRIARDTPLIEQPRQLLDRVIPGRWAEFSIYGSRAESCGASGGSPWVTPKVADAAGKYIFDAISEQVHIEAQDAGIVTSCAACYAHLANVRDTFGLENEVVHVVQLVAHQLS